MEDYVTVFFVAIILIGLIGLVSNIIVIIVYIFDKKLRSFTNYFFVNLSIVDILIVVLCLPVGLSDMFNDGKWMLGELACRVGYVVENVFLSVSSLTLISISLGRFFATKSPLQVSKYSNRKVILCVISSVWLVSLLISTPMYHFAKYAKADSKFINITSNAVGSGGNHNSGGGGEPIEYCYLDRKSPFCQVYVSALISLILFAPTLILTFVYVGIIRNLRTINKRYSTPDIDITAAAAMLSPNGHHLNHHQHRKSSARNNYEIVFRSSSTKPSGQNVTNSGSGDASLRIILLNRYSSVNRNVNGVCGGGGNEVGRSGNGGDVVSPKLSYEQIKRSFCTKNLIRKRRQTIILCTVAMTFFFCQIPIKIFQIFNAFYQWPISDETQFRLLNIVFLTTKLIYCFHSMSNPIIYNLMSSKFSRSYRKVLLCKSLSGSYSARDHNKPHHVNKICFKKISRNRASGLYDEFKSNSSIKRTSLINPTSQQQHHQQQQLHNHHQQQSNISQHRGVGGGGGSCGGSCGGSAAAVRYSNAYD